MRSWHDVALWAALASGVAMAAILIAAQRFYDASDAILVSACISVAAAAAAGLVVVHKTSRN